jgi:isovaleryl-CoA dehydrogenase
MSLLVSQTYDVLQIKMLTHGLGREIPESVAQKVDKENDFPAEMWQKLGEAGFLGVTVEEDHGGLAMGYQAHCVVMEELSRASGKST